MIASLPMYDRPEVNAATDRFWQAIHHDLGYGPSTLTRDSDIWDQWLSPDLLLSQTCGYPYRARLHGRVRLIGTPDYGLPGCPPGNYNSVLITRTDDPRTQLHDFANARFAYNEALSQSGWAAPQNHAASLGFHFSNPHQTGGHRMSAQAVAEGRADIAGIDALTWVFLQRHADFAKGLRVIDQTLPTPVLPYITALSRDPAPLFTAIQRAISNLSQSDRDTLHIRGLIAIPAQDYLAIPNPAPPPG